MSSEQPMIYLRNVWKKYSREQTFHRSFREDLIGLKMLRKQSGLQPSEFWALQDVTLMVQSGETVGIYGPNGAGKSTILKLMSGVTFSTQGTISVRGTVAPLIEIGAGFHLDLTGRENVYMNGAILGMKISKITSLLPSIIDFSEIGDFIDMPVKKYSSGMYMRLAFSIAVHSDADIFLVDEILSVGDERFQAKCISKIGEMQYVGKTLVVISHDHALLERVADRILYLNRGMLTSRDGAT